MRRCVRAPLAETAAPPKGRCCAAARQRAQPWSGQGRARPSSMPSKQSGHAQMAGSWLAGRHEGGGG
eukprot:2189308-Alexandrium_andersonii.AAC.1